MYFYLFGIHLLLVFSYAIFFLQFIKSLQNDLKDKLLFGILSLIFMILILIDGSKLILLNPIVAKSGIWLHVKLSFFIFIILENVVLFITLLKNKFFSRKLYELLYWMNYLLFLIIVSLSVFKFF